MYDNNRDVPGIYKNERILFDHAHVGIKEILN